MVKEETRKARLLSELCQELEKKDYAGDRADGITVSFRFASCGRVDHTFHTTSSVKVRCVSL